MKIGLLLVSLVFLLIFPVWASVPGLELINAPTATVLPRGEFQIGLRLYPQGGTLIRGLMGLVEGLTVGVAYGGVRIIDYQPPEWNPDVEFMLRFRIVQETQYIPAISLGYDGQGLGGYDSARNRYDITSRGIYLVASKFIDLFGPTRVHFGINSSGEPSAYTGQSKNASAFIGMDRYLNPRLVLVMEYDDLLNEEDRFFNLGFRWIFASEISLELDFENLFSNPQHFYYSQGPSRILRINYWGRF